VRRGEPRRRARLCTSVCVCAGHGVGGVLSSSGGRASLPPLELDLECRARRCCAGAAGNAAGLPVPSIVTRIYPANDTPEGNFHISCAPC